MSEAVYIIQENQYWHILSLSIVIMKPCKPDTLRHIWLCMLQPTYSLFLACMVLVPKMADVHCVIETSRLLMNTKTIEHRFGLAASRGETFGDRCDYP